MGKKENKRKRRKKKLPKRPSSSPQRGVGDQNTMFEYAEDENEKAKGTLVGGGGGGTAHCMEEMGIEEKVIGGREFIHKHGQPELTMYSDRLHLYSQSSGRCRLWMKNHRRYVRRVGHAPVWTDLLLTSADGQVCCEEWAEQTLSAKTVKNLI